MKILVAGANGQTGKLIVVQLIEVGHKVTALIRKEKQANQVSDAGAIALVKDINDQGLSEDIQGMDAVIFAAAGGNGHYQEVDHHGVRNLVEACQISQVDRFILISALGAHDPGSWGFAYKGYLQAKADGEGVLSSSNLDWTIIRPGSLNNGSAGGQVTLNQQPGGMGSIARADVAAVTVACLENNHSIGKTFELYDGNESIREAIAHL